MKLKSACYDEISYTPLKHSFNAQGIFPQGIFPYKLKILLRTPIFKTGEKTDQFLYFKVSVKFCNTLCIQHYTIFYATITICI